MRLTAFQQQAKGLQAERPQFGKEVTLNAELKGVDQAQAEALVAKAHTICPYSKATRGNIEVKLQANGNALQQTA